MDFKLTEETAMLRDMLRDFVVKEVEPKAKEWDETEKFPRETINKMAELGFFGVHYEQQYGGQEAGELAFCIGVEEVSRGSAGLGTIFLAGVGLAMYPITLHASEKQKHKYIPKVVKGGIAAFGLTEAGAGSDVAALATTYVKKGDYYVLNGSKIFITNGAEADIYTVFATKDKSMGFRGISAFIMDRNTPGFQVGKIEKKMGIHPSSTTELLFEDCKIPAENLIGTEGMGFKVALTAIDSSRVSVAAQAVGIAQAAYDAAVVYAKDRVQFGAQIARLEGIQWKIADMATNLDAARLLTYRAAWLTDQEHHVPIKEAAMAKLFASETAQMVCHQALQIHGGYGYTKDFPLERFARDQRITEIYEGTSEMQRWTIARQVLGVK